MSPQKYKRLWFQICDVLTYFSFPSPSPLTRDRQKNKICVGVWQTCLLSSLSQCSSFFTAGVVRVTLENQDALRTQRPTSTWRLSRFSLLTVKSYFTHLLLLSEYLNNILVLLNLNDPAIGSLKPPFYGGKAKIWHKSNRYPEGNS